MDTVKSFMLTAASIFLMLLGAYHLGGRAAKRAADIKRLNEAAKRARATIEVRSDVEKAIRNRTDDSVIDELHSDWLRR